MMFQPCSPWAAKHFVSAGVEGLSGVNVTEEVGMLFTPHEAGPGGRHHLHI